MLVFLIFEIFATLNFVSAQYSPVDNETTEIPPIPTYLGQVDGKGYYYNSSLQMNWDSASHYCGKFGWRLAEIKTQAQQDLFKSKTESGELWGGFWLGARDSTSISQVTWEGHDWPEDIKLQNFGQQMYFSTPLTCLYLSAWSSSSWATIQCSFEWFSPMCETIPKINYYRF